MKILHINQKYEKLGGTESVIENTINLLKKEKVLLFAIGKKEIKNNNKLIIKESNKFINFFRKFFFSFKIYKSLKNYIKETNPDIIHLHNHYNYSLSILLALKKSKKPVIQTIHDYGLICPTAWAVKKNDLEICNCVKGISYKCVKNKCITLKHYLVVYLRNKVRFNLNKKIIKNYIAPSKKLKQYLEFYKFKNIYYLPHFIDLKLYKKYNLKKQNKIIYVGHLGRNKGIEYLIKAMPLTLKKININLEIIGSGPDLNRLKNLTKKLNLHNKIRFIKPIKPKGLIKKYNTSKLLIFPSIWMEQFGMVGIEALACGLPVIGSNIGGIPDWLENNKVGFLFKRKNSRDIAEKVIKILTNPRLQKTFSKNALKISKKYNENTYLKNLIKIYKNLL